MDARTTAEGAPQSIASICKPSVFLYRDPTIDSPQDTQLLYGHRFAVHERRDKWVYGQALSPVAGDITPGYVGWVRDAALSGAVPDNNALIYRVFALKAPVFIRPDIKSRLQTVLPLGSLVAATTADMAHDDFIACDLGYLHRKHLAREGEGYATDFVTTAETHMGLPYIWAGISSDGLDCSGLVLSALRASGHDAPRDADMQEAALGQDVSPPYRRGDLVFWAGHVGIMTDDQTVLHANAFHMCVAREPLADAVARIGPVRQMRRLS